MFVKLQEGTLSGREILEYLVEATEDGFFEPGALLIMDNAAPHVGEGYFEEMREWLLEHDVFIVLLPAYSPEFNVCEFVFSEIKRYMRQHCDSTIPLSDRTITAFQTVSYDNIVGYYRHCTTIGSILAEALNNYVW